MYESHITVTNISLEDFSLKCKELGVKCLMIENDTGSNNLPQMMTACFHKGDFYQSINEMLDIAKHFPKIIRYKLELILSSHDEIPNNLYLEYHLKYFLNSSGKDFVKKVEYLGGHSSINSLKDGYFVTVRSPEGFQRIKEGLKEYKLMSCIRECVVLDTNPSLDSGWLCKDCSIKKYYNIGEK